MEPPQAACPGRPRVKPDGLLPQMDRKVVAREVTAAAGTQFGGAANPFREAGLVAITLDAVTIWGRQLLPVSVTNALLIGIKPLLVQVCGDFAGTLWGYAAALRPTVVIVRSCGGEIAGSSTADFQPRQTPLTRGATRASSRTCRSWRADSSRGATTLSWRWETQWTRVQPSVTQSTRVPRSCGRSRTRWRSNW
jgi:hypothetical protein